MLSQAHIRVKLDDLRHIRFPERHSGIGASAAFAEVLQRASVLLPVLTVKVVYGELDLLRELEAINVDTVAIGIGTGHVKRLDTALGTKQVPCDPGVEAVLGQVALTGKETKITGWNNQVDVAAHFAY